MRAITVITARLGSSRLPRKPLLRIGEFTALELLVMRLATARRPERMVLATTCEADDDALESEARRLGVDVHRGPTDDILQRWLQTAEAFAADLLVCADGDDLFCDALHVDRIVDAYERTGAGYITCEGLPFGTAPTGVSREALRVVCAAKTETDTAGQGRFFADRSLVSTTQVKAPPEYMHTTARMTLDYPEDLEFFRAVVDGLAGEGPVPPLRRIVEHLHENPVLVEINSGRQEEYWARFRALYPPVTLQSED